ncbi:hypothetical protein [Clostridium amazonitimonense]|uniref:hypothetical protein n=1 Tax=Clostridium amazonitimonense TaxID=1499689 RepID=UPI000509D98A|nr:hypothetical protein [Clostridium amazonitimonense]
METLNIKIELAVDIKCIKEVLKERDIAVNMSNMKKLAGIYKTRRYTISEKRFFEDVPKDRETLLMYGFTFEK